MKAKVLVVSLLAIALCGSVLADDFDSVSIPAMATTSGSQARFFPVAKDLIVPPGERVSQVLNVFNMKRVSVQAVANSTVGGGSLIVRVGFGPPLVGDPDAKLELSFAEQDTVRASSTTQVKAPRMALVIINDRDVPVKVTVGAYATD
ncbi:MAG TPA: hypothetical protein VFW45_13015 [Candidatus Polarisedimenticolia bacterium]|nr:hypothetical protein [Candidatus Polarisedimenticolia bacterium]